MVPAVSTAYTKAVVVPVPLVVLMPEGEEVPQVEAPNVSPQV
jgi:hypothetical protein